MKKVIRVSVMLLLMLTVLMAGTSYWLAGSADKETSLTILFTHDMHDNLLPFKVEQNGEIVEYGGYARLQTVINQERQKDPDLILMDGGDFSMGTLFQTIFSSEAPGLRLMGKMGYDVGTFGNHEFDFRPDGLASSLAAAKASQERLPELVISNLTFPTDTDGRTEQPLQGLQQAMYEYGVKNYTVLERKGYRIGIFGIIGKDAASNAPMAGVRFSDPVEEARGIVKKLENEEKVDLIVCLSHSGTVSDPKKSEDIILAQKVPEIDVIISGHSHTKLAQPMVVGDTYIGSAGEYGQNLGVIVLNKKSAGVWEKAQYRLNPINAGIAEDLTVSQRIDDYKNMVQQNYLDELGMEFDGILAYSPFSFTPLAIINDQHAEQPLGNLISDAYINAVKKAEGDNYQSVDVAIVPNGTVRASFTKGEIRVADAFNVSSLGIGPDKKSGYPLLTVYLTGQELKAACEVDASITPLMSAAQLYMSGITYTFNPHRFMFNKVTEAALLKPDGSTEEIVDDQLYRVAAGLYSAQMLSVVGDKSFGLLSIVPKTKEGKPITDFEEQIIRDGNGNEVKEWAALAKYLQSFQPVNGVPQVPAYYSEKQGRKVLDDDTSLGAILAKPNRIALAAYGLITFIALLIILTPIVIIRRRQRADRPAQHI